MSMTSGHVRYDDRRSSVTPLYRLSSYFIFILILLPVLASAQLFYGSTWSQYQQNSRNTGAFTYTPTNASFAGYANLPTGSGRETMFADLNNDGLNEVILYSGNYVYVLDAGLNVLYSHNNQKDMQSNPALILNAPTSSPNSYSQSVIIENNSFAVTRWNGNVWNTSYFTIPNMTSCTNWDGIKCNDYAGIGYGINQCYAVCYNGTTTRLFKYDPGALHVTPFVSMGNISIDGLHTGVLYDLDNDADDDYVFVCDANHNNKYGICVLEGSGQLETYYNGTGYTDDMSGFVNASANIYNPIVYNLDNVGDSEIIASYSLNGSDCSEIKALRASGTTYWINSGNATNTAIWCNYPTYTSAQISQPFIAYRNNTVNICTTHGGVGGAGTAATSRFACINGLNGNPDYRYELSGSLIVTIQNSKIYSSASYFNLNSDSNLVAGGYLINVLVNGTTSAPYNFSGKLDSTYRYSLGDINKDGGIDVVATSNSSTGNTYIFFSGNAVGAISNPNAMWNNNLTNSGIFGYFANSPICKGTNISFQAYECPHVGGCSYNNSIFTYEKERLVIDCGNGQTVYGALNNNAPLAMCTYSTTGQFKATIYLQDENHLSDYTQVQYIQVPVIDAIPGTTCNIPSAFVDTPNGNGQTPVDTAAMVGQGWEDLINILTGTNSVIKMILGVFIIIMMIVGIAQYTTATIVMVIITFLGTILNVVMGLWPAYILILILIGGLLMFLIGKFITSNKESG